MIYAVYRVLYGSDFLFHSISSIIDAVDKVFIFWTDKPRGHVTEVVYKGSVVKLQYPFDDILQVFSDIRESFGGKVEFIYDAPLTDEGQFSHQVNDIILPNYSRPDKIVFLEYDHIYTAGGLRNALEVFKNSGYISASTHPVEFWKNTNYMIPFRNDRKCTVFWDMSRISTVPKTGRHADIHAGDCYTGFINYTTHNYGFCIAREHMYLKHLVGIATSIYSGDSLPRDEWFDVWDTWTPEVRNLEISKGYESNIPYAILYDSAKYGNAPLTIGETK